MVDFRSRSVRLGSTEGKEILFFGKQSDLVNRIISIVSAKNMIIQGTDTYLLCIMDTPKSEIQISQVPVVREFLDVFPEEHLGMPHEREIEFLIELEPRTTPISCMSYKMVSL